MPYSACMIVAVMLMRDGTNIEDQQSKKWSPMQITGGFLTQKQENSLFVLSDKTLYR